MADETAEQLAIFSDYLKRRSLRMTRQRKLVVETFLRSEGHLSTDELYDLVKQRDSKLGYTTVFRTLKALTDCGLARKTDLADGRTRFEHLYKHPHHHHIVCAQCNRTIEFLSPELERLQEQIVAKYDFQLVRSRFQIFGVCRSCLNQQASRQQTYPPDLVFARDALKIAIETEERGVRFYRTASRTVLRPSTRKIFQTMLGDEKKHLARLRRRWDQLLKDHRQVLEAPLFLHFNFNALQEIFPSREEISQSLNANLTEEEALKLAMNMEKDAFNFFSQYADGFNDTRGRDIFLKFAEEEQEHYEIIRQTYEKSR